MRRMIAAIGLACAAASPAAAQFTVPGQPVGTAFNLPNVGNRIPKAAPPAAMPIGTPHILPYDPARHLDVFKGTNIDPNSVVGPVSGFPGIATQQPNLLERIYTKIATFTGFYKPTLPNPVTTYTPGITRRNRERADDRMWRRD
jgi:hypothetical protein